MTARSGMQAKTRYDAILFDMGYTLVFFEPVQNVIVRDALRDVGVERSAEEIEAAVQKVWGQYYQDARTTTFPATEEYDRQVQANLGRSLLSRLGLHGDEETLQTYMESVDARFSRPGVMRSFPEVPGVLTSLRNRGYRLGIVSNWSWNLRERVAQVDLDGFFELVWASAYAGSNKPHPEIFHQALEKMSLSPERVLYVGDSYEHDVVGARNAGLGVVLLDRDGALETPDCPVIHDLWGVVRLLQA
jgi:putative hydrolase of the HAD superfamily